MIREGVRARTPCACRECNDSVAPDEAFLRRIRTKVEVEDVDEESFDRIAQRLLETHRVPAEAGCAALLRESCLAAGARLHACYPADIYRLVKSICEYEGRTVRMTRANIGRAAALYFARQ